MEYSEFDASFWKNIISSVGAEYKNVDSIRGASGIAHPIVSLGVDEERKRVIVVSGENDPRTAALIQADIQPILKDYNIIISRPHLINFTIIIDDFIKAIGTSVIKRTELFKMLSDKKFLEKKFTPILDKYRAAIQLSPISWSYKIIHSLNQLLSFNLKESQISTDLDPNDKKRYNGRFEKNTT